MNQSVLVVFTSFFLICSCLYINKNKNYGITPSSSYKRDKVVSLIAGRNVTSGEHSILALHRNPPFKAPHIQSPDYTIKVPKTTIKAAGVIPYRTMVIKPNFSEDKWIKEIEYIVKSKVLHHIAFDIYDRNTFKKKKNSFYKNYNKFGTYYFFIPRYGWASGATKHWILPNDSGIKIPKNSKIFFEAHYEPIGREITDNSTEIRFVFHKNPPRYHFVTLRLYDKLIKIPPGEQNYKSELAYQIKRKLLLTGIHIHMHLRGKASSVFIIEPNGKKQKFFGLDPWHFHFQRYYFLKKPLAIAKNSMLKCINYFDNSLKNTVNPNPKQVVLWGRNTKDEMSTCSFNFLLPSSENFLNVF